MATSDLHIFIATNYNFLLIYASQLHLQDYHEVNDHILSSSYRFNLFWDEKLRNIF